MLVSRRARWQHGICAALAVSFVMIAPAAHGQNPRELLGRWEGWPTSTEGIGHIMDFTSTGAALCTPGSLVMGSYRVSGGNLTQMASAPPETVTVRVVFRADTMIQYAGNKLDSMRLVRRSSAAATSIVGGWRSKSPTGKESLVDYYADGTFKLWVPFDTDPGKYQLSADTITIDVPKGKLNGRYLWLIVGDKLQLQPLGGALKPPTFTLTRFGS